MIVSTLGHNLSFKGMFGNPRRLVADSIERLCKVIEKKRINKPVKKLNRLRPKPVRAESVCISAVTVALVKVQILPYE